MGHCLAAQPQTHTSAQLGDAVAQAMRAHGVPGMAIAVSRQGRHAFHNFGVASRATNAAVSSDTLFEIGSVSKTFTATLAALAQSTGRLALTDSPAKFLPELRGTPIAEVDLLALATHTAGGFPLQVPDGIDTAEQLTAYLRAWQPSHAPGTARSYANPSIGLLGMATARAWGMPFDEALQRMFAALGLRDTYIDVPEAAMSRYAQGYNKADAPVRVNPGMLSAEAYGVKTSARDLIRFIDLNLDPSRLEKPLAQALESTRTGYFQLGAMTQGLVWEQYAAPPALDALLEGNSSQVAYETHAVKRLAPARAPQPDAWVNKTGSTNGFGAYVAFVPARQAGVVILANRNFPIEARVRLAVLLLQGQER
ncbi:MAG: class C beta-lactamase [Comamonas sp.]